MKDTLSSRTNNLKKTINQKDKDLNTTNNTFRMDPSASYEQP
jgi:hypothetical protein